MIRHCFRTNLVPRKIKSIKFNQDITQIKIFDFELYQEVNFSDLKFQHDRVIFIYNQAAFTYSRHNLKVILDPQNWKYEYICGHTCLLTPYIKINFMWVPAQQIYSILFDISRRIYVLRYDRKIHKSVDELARNENPDWVSTAHGQTGTDFDTFRLYSVETNMDFCRAPPYDPEKNEEKKDEDNYFKSFN